MKKSVTTVTWIDPEIVMSESHSVRLFVTPWAIQSMEFPRQDLPNPGIEPGSPALQADSLPAEPQGKPKNTRVDSLSLLQRIFPTQESNGGLLHCRWILYQLPAIGINIPTLWITISCLLIYSLMNSDSVIPQPHQGIKSADFTTFLFDSQSLHLLRTLLLPLLLTQILFLSPLSRSLL